MNINWKQVLANPRNDLSKRTSNDIDNEIKNLEIFLSKIEELSINDIYDKFSNLITGHVRTVYEIKPQGVFRARINFGNKEFDKVQDLWYPDWKKINEIEYKLGRCNDKGESLFYCSTDLNTTIVEIRPKLGDIITTIDYKPTQNRKEVIAKTKPIGLSYLQKIKDYEELFRNHFNKPNNTIENNLKLDNYLNAKFHEIVKDDENFRYKSSIAISKILLGESNDCLFYPSISYKLKQANLAFKPQYADVNFDICDGFMWKVTKVIGDSFYELIKIKQLNSIGYSKDIYFKDAKIEWREPRTDDQDKIIKIEY